jgi:hypothetical protein
MPKKISQTGQGYPPKSSAHKNTAYGQQGLKRVGEL